MQNRPLDQRFTDIQSFISTAEAAGKVDPAQIEAKRSTLAAEGQQDQTDIATRQGEKAQMNSARQTMTTKRAELYQDQATAQAALDEFNSGIHWFPGERRRALEQVVADKKALVDAKDVEISREDSLIAAKDGEIKAAGVAVQAGPFLQTRLTMAAEELGPTTSRALKDRAQDWAARLDAAQRDGQAALSALRTSPQSADAKAAVEKAIAGLVTSLKTLKAEAQADTGVVETFRAAIRGFAPVALEPFERAGVDQANAQANTLAAEPAAELTSVQRGTAALTDLVRNLLSLTDGDYANAIARLAQYQDVSGRLASLVGAFGSLAQLVGAYTAAARGRADAVNQLNQISNDLTATMNDLTSSSAQLQQAQMALESLRPEFERTHMAWEQTEHRMHEIEEGMRQLGGNIAQAQQQWKAIDANVAQAQAAGQQAQAQAQRAQSELPAAQQALVEAQKPRPGTTSYTVQRGDTPGAIAARFGISDWHVILRANQAKYPTWKDDRTLQAGWTLTIPTTGAPDPAAIQAAQSRIQALNQTIAAARPAMDRAAQAAADGARQKQDLQRQIDGWTGQQREGQGRMEHLQHERHEIGEHMQQLKGAFEQQQAVVAQWGQRCQQLDSRRVSLQQGQQQAQSYVQNADQTLASGQQSVGQYVASVNASLAAYNASAAGVDTTLTIADLPGYRDFTAAGIGPDFVRVFGQVASSPNSADLDWLNGLGNAATSVTNGKSATMSAEIRRLTDLINSKEQQRFQAVAV